MTTDNVLLLIGQLQGNVEGLKTALAQREQTGLERWNENRSAISTLREQTRISQESLAKLSEQVQSHHHSNGNNGRRAWRSPQVALPVGGGTAALVFAIIEAIRMAN